jgi:hypothetical protein
VPSFAAALALFAGAATLPRGRSRSAFIGLLATSALLTLYSAEARPYALLALLAFGAFRLALTGAETPVRLLGLALCCAAALYSHYLAIFVVAALFALALSARRWRSSLALAAGAAAFVPWVPVLRAQPPSAMAWMRETAPASLAGFLSALGGVGRIPAPFGGPVPRVLFLAGLSTGVFLLAVVAVSAARARQDRELREALLFVVAVLAAALLTAGWRPVAFAGRTEMAVLPVWFWALARAAADSRLARGGTLAAAACGIGATAFLLVSGSPRTEPADVAAAVSRVSRNGDRIVAAASLYLPLRREADRGRLAGSLSALPEEVGAHPGWFMPALPGPQEVRAVARATAELPAGRRLYLVIPPAYATPDLLAALGAPGGRSRELSRGPDALVILRTQDPAPAPPAARSGP